MKKSAAPSEEKDNPRNMRWVFTLNNYTPENIEEWKELEPEVKWSIIGYEEAPETGTPHLQGCVVFKQQVRLSAVRKIFQRKAHWEPMSAKATLQDNFDYCSKGGKYEEIGTRPVFEDNGTREKKRHKRAAELAKSGDWDKLLDECPDLVITHYKGLQFVENKFGDKPKPLSPSKPLCDRFLWIYGPAGTGKSRMAFERFPQKETFNKSLNKWWDGYENEPHVVLDDISNKDEFIGHFLKTWCDYQPITVEHKGFSKKIRPKYVTVTSNWHPGEIWSDSKMIEPIMRRFTIDYLGPAGMEFKQPSAGTVGTFHTPHTMAPPSLSRTGTIRLTRVNDPEQTPTRASTPVVIEPIPCQLSQAEELGSATQPFVIE